jgi:ditrans,polycis-polyprenyl diphosphate synthase
MIPRLLVWFVKFPVLQYLLAFFHDFIIELLRTGPVPNHVAFVMDGNRRYAKNNDMPLSHGHYKGFETLIKILEVSGQLGIRAITVYAFSIENFNRPKHEVDILFDLIRNKMIPVLNDSEFRARYGARVQVLGNRDMIPQDILEAIEEVEAKTKDFDRIIINICFPYTTRDDITHAIRTIAQKVDSNEMTMDDINLQSFEEHLYCGNSPPLDILVRTSGVSRLSDFMLWESNLDCQLVFINALWPEFSVWDFYRILIRWSYKQTRALRYVIFLLRSNPFSSTNK